MLIILHQNPMTEQAYFGEYLKRINREEDWLTVEVTEGVGGGTSNIQPAMLFLANLIYPEYTGTAWSAVLKRTDTYDESLFNELSQAYKRNIILMDRHVRFNNTYGMGCVMKLLRLMV